MEKKEFYSGGKKVDLFLSEKENRPLLYLNAFSDIGASLFSCLTGNKVDVNLVQISALEWNRDLSPWPFITDDERADQFLGGASEYLDILTNEIIPETERNIHIFSYRILAGYSLSGLFALHSAFNSSLFSHIASVSGSLWYPGFKEYVASHELNSAVKKVYISLGEREKRTRNPYMKTVEDDSREIESIIAERKIETILEFNPGNHFANSIERIAKGIMWLIS